MSSFSARLGDLRSGQARAGNRSRERPRCDKALEEYSSRVVNAKTAADNCLSSARSWLILHTVL